MERRQALQGPELRRVGGVSGDMGCFFCFDPRRGRLMLSPSSASATAGGGGGSSKDDDDKRGEEPIKPSARIDKLNSGSLKLRIGSNSAKKQRSMQKKGPEFNISSQTFTLRELQVATKNFRQECFLGEGGFGRVYKGKLQNTGQVVAVKRLNRNGVQGNREFLVEVLVLSLLNHPNLVKLIGYCADGDQRLLVYEFMPLGSLEDHLHDFPPDKEPLDWNSRMKIAVGAAKGLDYLHDKANPPVIYRDFKSSNILLDEDFQPKLSDFGLAKLGPTGDESHVSTRVMGTYGYCAPEYAMTGQLTVKSDVYSFGVVFLELITGRRAIDSSKAQGQQNLVAWARPFFNDRKKLAMLADPALQGRFPMRGIYQAVAVASMCIQVEAAARPHMADVVTALSYLVNQHDHNAYDPNGSPALSLLSSSSSSIIDDSRRRRHQSSRDEVATEDRDPGRSNSSMASATSTDQNKNSFGSSSGSGRKLDAQQQQQQQDGLMSGKEEQHYSPRDDIFAILNNDKDFDRQRALAEAKMWGENLRDKCRGGRSGGNNGSFNNVPSQ